MAKRPKLEELYDNAIAAIKRAQALEPGAGEAALAADRAWVARCKLEVKEGVTRGGNLRPGFAEKIKTDPAFAKEWAGYMLEDIYQPSVLRRCKEQEGYQRGLGREERKRKLLRKGAIDLENTSYNGPAAIERKASGKEVILYHGTTTKLLKKILERGLVIGAAKVDPQETPGVYLSARYGGHGSSVSGTDAVGYANRAAGRLGGKPVVFTVRVPWNDLSWDTDDEDIASGNWQFVTDFVPPEAIIEIDGEPRKGLLQ